MDRREFIKGAGTIGALAVFHNQIPTVTVIADTLSNPTLDDRVSQLISTADKLLLEHPVFKKFYDKVIGNKEDYFKPYLSDEELMSKLHDGYNVGGSDDKFIVELNPEAFFSHWQNKDTKDKPYIQRLLFHPFTVDSKRH